MDNNLLRSRSSPAIAKANASNLYWNRMEALYQIFRFMGFIPYTFDAESNRIDSPTVRVCLWTVFATVTHCVILGIQDAIRLQSQFWDTYDNALQSVLRFLFTNTFVYFLALWWERHKIVNYVNNWAEFIIEFEKIATTPIICFSKNGFRIFLVASTLNTLFIVFLYMEFFLRTLNPFLYLFLFITVHMTSLLTTFWAAHCFWICQVTKSLSHNLITALTTNSDSSLLHSYRLLWLKLRQHTVILPEVFEISNTLNITANFVNLILGTYSWGRAVLYTKDPNPIIGLSLPVIWNTMTLMAICQFGHIVSQEVGQKLITTLLTQTHTKHEQAVRDEIDLMLDTFEGNSSDLVIHGFLTINRNTLVQIVSYFVTYIIVLLQFDED